MRSWLRKTLTVSAGVTVLTATALIPPAAAVQAPVPELAWSACGAAQCATAEVPLDYDEPGGDTITLALRKIPATDAAGRIGTLFVNLGGPGEVASAGPTFLLMAAALPPEVRAKFDVVGIDPRGAGGSAPITCGPAPGQDPAPKPDTMIPETPQEIQVQLTYDDYLRASCDQTAGPILDHMSIADTARDMDLIREAVGDEQLTFYGLSYGSLLGQTYAALFPDRVRAMVLDGVLDPVASTTGRAGDQRPIGLRRGGPEAMEDALASALDQCDRAGFLRCPIAGLAMQRWQRVHDSLAQNPMQLGPTTIDGRVFRGLLTVAAFQFDHMGGQPLRTIELLTVATRVIEVLRFGLTMPGTFIVNVPGQPDINLTAPGSVLKQRLAGVLQAMNPVPPQAPPPDDVSNGLAQQYGALCTDSVNPADPEDWIKAAEDSVRQAPRFGPLMVWAYSACAGWPGSDADAYHGPFNTDLNTPPLLIGNTHDNATPFGGADAAHQLLPGSRLVTLDSWGHTAIGKSTCVTSLVERYLVDQALPAQDQNCKPDYKLFGLSRG